MKTKPILRRWLRRSSLLFALVVLIGVLAYAFAPKPELKAFTHYSTALLDNRGSLMRITLAEDDRYRLYQDFNEISPKFVQTTLLYEDQDYYSHPGVDLPALFRAFWETYILRERRVGASTIVMQVARLRWNIPSHTFSGKVAQIIRALQLSRHYSKQELLEAYLNLAPYGGNIEGIGAASLIYFNKHPSKLSLLEALTLAVIPQNPNKRNPTKAKGLENLLTARRNLFERWVEGSPQDLSSKKYLDLPLNVRSKSNLPRIAPHFTQYLMNNRSRWQHGIVNTTLATSQQKKLENVIANYVSSKSDMGINNASALLLNYQSMEIEAMVGSADFYNNELLGQVNGTLAKRSPGSTLKPFVYGLAIDEGLIHPMTLLKDSPRLYGGFTPENYDKQFVGPIVAKDALIQSRNVPAVVLQSRLKQRSFYDFLQQAGVSDLKAESHYGLALALGGGELTMLELVGLYSVLANQGIQKSIISTKPQPTTKQNHSDKSQTNASLSESKQLLSAEASFLILDMLKDNLAPDAISLDSGIQQKNQVAWKTGTSWAFRDAWAVGVSGPYVLAIWVGNFDGESNNAFVGRSAAGPLLFSAFDALLPRSGWRLDSFVFQNQLNVRKVEVCANTGDLFEKHCPAKSLTWFIPGVSPIKTSNIYRRIAINKTNGLRACKIQQGQTEFKVYEFWPSDFLTIFNQAGISLKTPPAYDPKCSLNQKSNTGQIPIISSPQSRIEYVIQSDKQSKKQIPFLAVVDPDVEQVYWFVNGKFEGISKRGEAYIWNASNGEFLVSAVDDSGRAARKDIKVIQIR